MLTVSELLISLVGHVAIRRRLVADVVVLGGVGQRFGVDRLADATAAEVVAVSDAWRQVDRVRGGLRHDDLGAPDLAAVAEHADLGAGAQLVHVHVDDVRVLDGGESAEPLVCRVELTILQPLDYRVALTASR